MCVRGSEDTQCKANAAKSPPCERQMSCLSCPCLPGKQQERQEAGGFGGGGRKGACLGSSPLKTDGACPVPPMESVPVLHVIYVSEFRRKK